VALNLTRQRWRKKTIRSIPVHESQYEESAEDDPAILISETEYRDFIVDRAVRLMQSDFEPNTWQAFWQFVVCDRPAADVARQFGLTENAVYLARVRVLKRLRQELAGLLD
jgi:RNA polymerase sigma-70 factor (ECF subfamily)